VNRKLNIRLRGNLFLLFYSRNVTQRTNDDENIDGDNVQRMVQCVEKKQISMYCA